MIFFLFLPPFFLSLQKLKSFCIFPFWGETLFVHLNSQASAGTHRFISQGSCGMSQAMSYTGHLNHSLNCKHRGSVRGCAPFSLHAVLVPAGHLASSLGSAASAGISSRPGAQAGSRYSFIPALHHWP